MRNACLPILVALLLVAAPYQDAEGKKMGLEEARAALVSLRKVCMEHVGAPAALVEQAREAAEYPNDRKLQCYNKCILTMTKAMKDDKLREKVMLNQVDLMLVDEVVPGIKVIISKCVKEVTSTDGCEAAWQFIKCYIETENGKELMIF